MLNNTVLKDAVGDKNRISNQLFNRYGDSNNLQRFLKFFEFTINSETPFSVINSMLIKFFCSELEIFSKFAYSSEFNLKSKRSARVIEILKITSATEYLAAPGSKDYMSRDTEWNVFEGKVTFFDYMPQEYKQNGLLQFRSHMSIIDGFLSLEKGNLINNVHSGLVKPNT